MDVHRTSRIPPTCSTGRALAQVVGLRPRTRDAAAVAMAVVMGPPTGTAGHRGGPDRRIERGAPRVE